MARLIKLLFPAHAARVQRDAEDERQLAAMVRQYEECKGHAYHH